MRVDARDACFVITEEGGVWLAELSGFPQSLSLQYTVVARIVTDA
jgi:hypothetical protein